MVARGAKNVSLKARVTDAGDVALLTYTAGGSVHHTLIWGALNGPGNATAGPAEQFKINYSGGYGSVFGTGYWQTIVKHNQCQTYKGRGPTVHLSVAACALPDGTFFLAQSWIGSQLRDNGWKPATKPQNQIWVSHYTKALPSLELDTDWILADKTWRNHVYGRLLDPNGNPVYGSSSTSRGNPTDSFGRLITIDTLNPPWSTGFRQAGGWYRYNSFLTHKGSGIYCDGIYKTISGVRARSIAGKGRQYRAIVNGPGVTPVLQSVRMAPSPTDKQGQINTRVGRLSSWSSSSTGCN